MFNKVDTTYTTIADEKERLKRISEILSEGIYAYIRKKGLLREDLKRTDKINRLLSKIKEVGAKAKDEMEDENI